MEHVDYTLFIWPGRGTWYRRSIKKKKLIAERPVQYNPRSKPCCPLQNSLLFPKKDDINPFSLFLQSHRHFRKLAGPSQIYTIVFYTSFFIHLNYQLWKNEDSSRHKNETRKKKNHLKRENFNASSPKRRKRRKFTL